MFEQQEILLDKKDYPLISPVLFGRHTCGPGHSCGPTTRQYWLLHYIVSGKGHICVDNAVYPVRDHQCFVIKPYQMTYYEADAVEPWKYVWVGFTSEIPLPSALTERPVFEAEHLQPVFHRLAQAVDNPDSQAAFVYGQIWELIARSQTGAEAPMSKGESYVMRAKSYIEAYYMRSVTVQEIASHLHLDRSYFSAIFRKHTGYTPQYYVYKYRMEQAMDLLVKYGYSPTQTAIAVGYGNEVSFSHMFKQYYGHSPKYYAAGETKK